MPAVTDSYASISDYLAFVDGDDDAMANQAALQRALTQAARAIDRYTGRFFTKDATPVARTFRAQADSRRASRQAPLNWAESENPYLYGGWARVLTVDDLAAAPTEVIIDTDGDGLFTDETALASTDYELWPLNATTGPEPRPYQQLYIPPSSNFSGFQANVLVRVTAVWGWPAVPEPVVRINAQLAGSLRLVSQPARYKRISIDGQTLEYADAKAATSDLLEDLRAYVKAPLL